jgi:capsular exopolysaccharide synthesis family protein
MDTRGDDYYNTQAEILKGRTIAGKVVDFLDSVRDADTDIAPTSTSRMLNFNWPSFNWRSLLPFESPKPPGGPVKMDPRERKISAYLSGLSIRPIGGTQLMRINYDSVNPRVAARNANAHADAYIESMLEARFAIRESASNWMSRRLDELRSKLQESEERLQAYREQEQLIDSQGIQALSTMQINDLTGRLVEARGRLSSARITYLQVFGDGPEPIESVPAMLDNGDMRRARDALVAAEQKMAVLSQRYGPKHPRMIEAQSEVAEAADNLDTQQRVVSGGIRAEYMAAQSEVRALEQELEAAKQGYQEVSRKGASLSELQRDVETNRQLYDLFYNRLRETAQTSDLESVNARVVQLATVPVVAPILPKKESTITMALAFGLALGVGIAFLLEQIGHTIRNTSSVEDVLGLQLLGSVPILSGRARENAATALFDEQEGGFGEAVRTIRTGLSLSASQGSNKVIQVTSSVPGEGKSTIAMNLALAFAKVERVLLVDADMRRPSIARELALDTSGPGLPEVLAGTAYLNKSISFLDDHNLEILKVGSIPSDPLELLSSKSFSKTMKTLRETYDRIIIDSPPMLPLSDSEVISTHVDSIVYIIQFDSTNMSQINGGLKRLGRHLTPIAGVVLNKVDIKKAESYGDYTFDGYDEYTGAGENKKRRHGYASAASL